VLFGLSPALRAARVDLNTSMKTGGRTSQGDGGLGGLRRRLRSVLVVAEVAISLMLLIGAGLLIRSFVRIQKVSPGFEADGVISMRVGPTARRFQNRDEVLAFNRPFGDALAAVPGVTMRGSVTSLPFTSSVGCGSINVEGWTPQPGQELQVDQRGATTDYFRTMKIPLLQGRGFNDLDLAANAGPVCIIDEKFAQRFWPNGDAIGKHLWNNPNQKMSIVGVVGTVKQYGLDIDGRIVVYRPSPNSTMTVIDIRTMSDRMSASLARQRFATVMLGSFALFALILAIVGIYGVISHLVTQGAHDIGIRMALGAERRNILIMVLRQGVELACAGIVLGLLGAALLTRVMAGLLFGISTTDVLTFSLVPIVLIATAMLATYIPAMRATRVDPVVVLRDE